MDLQQQVAEANLKVRELESDKRQYEIQMKDHSKRDGAGGGDGGKVE